MYVCHWLCQCFIPRDKPFIFPRLNLLNLLPFFVLFVSFVVNHSIPAIGLTILVLLSGCSPSSNTFQVNLEGRDRAKSQRAEIEAIGETMDRLFGTPDMPVLPEGVGLDHKLLAQAAGPTVGDEQGNQKGLYRQHCAACHGISGDGAGPAASMLGPYPRDFRLGLFKYTSTRDGGHPTRDDIRRTLLHGVPDTAMPSFAELPEQQIDALVEYVAYLSMRGEIEQAVAQLVLDEGEYFPLDRSLIEDEAVLPIAERWAEAPSLAIDYKKLLALEKAPPTDTPKAMAASIDRGRELYMSNNSQCIMCHGPEGRGDGEQRELYDDWNKPKKGVSEAQTRLLAERFTLPLVGLRARNFHQGIFRGGTRPEDICRRIHVGIKGTPMPSSGPDSSTKGVFSASEIRDVTNFILSLSGN